MNRRFAYIQGSMRGGYVLMFGTFIFLGVTTILVLGIAGPMFSAHASAIALKHSSNAFLTSSSAGGEVVYKIARNMQLASSEQVVLSSGSASIAVNDSGGIRTVVIEGVDDAFERTVEMTFVRGTGANFHYGIQSGEGGIDLQNSSSVRGNIFSNGPVTGANSNIVRGSIVSAGPSGLIDGVYATGTASAHSIYDSVINGDAYFQVISGTTVGGTQFPGSTDPATSTLPISDATIEKWKNDALLGGTYSGSCPYKITQNTTIGPLKIPCNLEISGSPDVTIAGHVWVEGDVKIQNTATLSVDNALSGESVVIVADNPSNPTISGTIDLTNSVTFEGAGDGSYIFFISQNTSAEEGGGNVAIRAQNSVSGDVLVYAPHGRVRLSNSIAIKEVSAYRIEVQNSAEVVYESGLTNVLFTAGPSGGWERDSWQEI